MRYCDWRYFLIKEPRLFGGLIFSLRGCCEFIRLFTSDTVFASDIIARLRHAIATKFFSQKRIGKPAANSGIKYFVDPELNKGQGSAIGLEFQILDDQEHPDAKKGKNGNRTVGSLYDLIRAENSDSSRGKNFKGVGKWNNARIVVKGGRVQHWLNQVKVVEFDRHSQIFKALVEKSKYEKWENFGRLPAGHILLQDHGDEVEFKNVKIREF